MKKLVMFAAMAIIALLLPAAASAGIDRFCYQNYTLIKCGEQPILVKPDFCQDINLTIDECFIENSTLNVVFEGVDSFEIPHELYYITASLYARDWTFIANKNSPLPENSSIKALDNNKLIFSYYAGSKKIESVQITVPFCYDQVDSDKEKIYPRTQTGKKCISNDEGKGHIEEPEEAPVQNNPRIGAEFLQTAPEDKGIHAKDIVLFAIMAVAIIIGILAFAPGKPKKKKRK